MKKIITSFLFFGAALVCSLSLTHAQVSATIELYPKNPEPKSDVTLTFKSYSFDANTASLVWTVNGKKVLEGEGETKLIVRTGEVGDAITVTVRASTQGGFTTAQSITVTPASVMIMYESPKSYVPLLYEGKSLPGEGALIRVSAFPSIGDSGGITPPSKLSYTWYINDTLFKDVSGAGKQSALIRLDYLQSKNTIKVIVRSPSGASAEKTITIYPHAVMPLLYTFDSVLGVNYTKLIDKRFETVNEFIVSLEPFYVSDEETKRASFVWYLDGFPSTPLGGRILALQPKENSYGTKMLSIDVYGTDKRLQKASIKTELIFDTRK